MEHANSIFRIKVKGKYVVKLYRHTSLKLLTEIHRWILKIWAAYFSKTTIKIFSAITNYVVMYFLGTVPTLQMIDVKPDSLAAQVLYVMVPIFTGSVQTDKLYVQ